LLMDREKMIQKFLVNTLYNQLWESWNLKN
jgi:hypothetical protein